MATHLKLVSALRKSARLTVRIVAWIPVLIVSLVLIWGYYVFVYVMNFSGKFDLERSRKTNYERARFLDYLIIGTFPKGSPVVSTLVSGGLIVAFL